MYLNEWKVLAELSRRDKFKQSIREGAELEIAESLMEELKEEIEIEDFCEEVDFEGEIELTEAVDGDDLQEVLEFQPEVFGEKMDIEVEIDTTIFELSTRSLNQIKELFFAESYEVSIDEAQKAKVVFKRAGGKIAKKKKCGPGMTLRGNKCLPQTGTKKAKLRKIGIKIKRAKKASGGGVKKKAILKAKVTKRRVTGRARNYSGIK